MASVDEEIDRLQGLSTFELRKQWRRQWKQPPPMRLSRDMLVRGLAWKIQELHLGGIGKAERRKLTAFANATLEHRNAERDAAARGGVDAATGWSGGTCLNRNSLPPVISPSVTLREGNRLVRAWNGTTHSVLVLASGFEWQGKQYCSLSQIAEAITGAHWSGPRFFGLTNRKGQGASEKKKSALAAVKGRGSEFGLAEAEATATTLKRRDFAIPHIRTASAGDQP